jgi:hypothetical protein
MARAAGLGGVPKKSEALDLHESLRAWLLARAVSSQLLTGTRVERHPIESFRSLVANVLRLQV